MKKVSNAKKLGDIHVFYIFFIVFIIKSPVEFPVLDEKNPFHDHGPGISSFHHEEIVIILTSLLVIILSLFKIELFNINNNLGQLPLSIIII